MKLKKHKRRVYDLIISLRTQSCREEPGLVPKLLQSIVIQQKPGGRELIISRFSGIIEQMCFEIGHLTIAMPVVISSHTGMVCNAETKRERREGRQNYSTVFMKYNSVTAHNSPPQRLLGRQLTFDLSETLAIRCLRLASFKLVTLQDPDLQEFEHVLN